MNTESASELNLLENVSARQLTTFGVGGAVRFLFDVETLSAAETAVKFALDRGLKFFFLGNGSNVVLPDGTLDGVLIRLGRGFNRTVGSEDELLNLIPRKLDKDEVLVLGATPLMSLSRKTSLEDRTGLEFAAGIPGTVGGAVRMNAGAHNSMMSSIVTGAIILNSSIRFQSDLGFSYRHTNLTPNDLVLGAVLKLPRGEGETIRKKRQESLDYRKRTQPLHLPSSGSVFRNPPGEKAAAHYLEQVGLKGERLGGVMYSEMHSNWLVRISDEARSQEVIRLIELGKRRVFEEFGISLTPEILLW